MKISKFEEALEINKKIINLKKVIGNLNLYITTRESDSYTHRVYMIDSFIDLDIQVIKKVRDILLIEKDVLYKKIEEL